MIRANKYIDGPGQRYVGIADVTIWLARQSSEAMAAYVAEYSGQANPDVLATLKTKYQALNALCLKFVEEHNVGSAEIMKGESNGPS